MNKRLIQLREALNITQRKMGSELGVTPAAISRLESGDRSLTEQMVIAISRTYNVNPDWLRSGEGDMFIESDVVSLDEYAKKNHISDFETEIIKGYLSLSPEVRNQFMGILRAASKVTEGKKILSALKTSELSSGAPIAAHNDAEMTDEEKENMQKDIEDLKNL